MSADDMTLAEIEARLNELDDEEQQAEELAGLFIDATDALATISTHSLVGSETETKISMLRHMLRQIRQFDMHEREAIHHERDALRQQARELKHAEEDSEARNEDGESA
jgi:DNA-binding transcriptional MerR regulator